MRIKNDPYIKFYYIKSNFFLYYLCLCHSTLYYETKGCNSFNTLYTLLIHLSYQYIVNALYQYVLSIIRISDSVFYRFLIHNFRYFCISVL